jgi:hypothetical protein
MNEVMFYGGIVLSVSFFILTVFLFIYNKVPYVIKYFIQIRRKKVFRTALVVNKVSGVEASNVKLNKNISSENENTVLLDDVECYVTALLDDESTSLLPEYDNED